MLKKILNNLIVLPYTKIFYNALTSAMIYGTWTYFANDTGAFFSALIQASISFLFTFFIAFYLEVLHRKVKTFRVTVICSVGLIIFLGGVQALIHYFINTENILSTVLPSYIVGSIYITLYLIHLKRGNSV